MAEDVAGFSAVALGNDTHGNGKWIVGIVCRGGHGQSDDQRGFGVEGPGGKDEEGMHVAHFLPDLGIAVDPEDVLPPGRPDFFTDGFFERSGGLDRYHCSAPIADATMTSPP